MEPCVSKAVEQRKSLSHNVAGTHITWEAAKQSYDKWASTYDKDHTYLNYSGPEIAASALCEYVCNKQADILDVACGTGFVGECLTSLGYTCVDGLDGSAEMLKQAEHKRVYRKLIYECLSTEPSKNICDSSYDAVVMCGAFGGGHLAANIWNEIIRITKTGGYIINVMREKWLQLDAYKDKLESTMEQLVLEGKWVKIRREVLEQYVHTDTGVIHVYRVT